MAANKSACSYAPEDVAHNFSLIGFLIKSVKWTFIVYYSTVLNTLQHVSMLEEIYLYEIVVDDYKLNTSIEQ